MKRHVLTVLMSFAAAMISGAVFVVALLHQFALVEVPRASSPGCKFFLSSAISDLLDEKKEPNRARNSAVPLMTAFLVAFYSLTRFFH